MPRDTTNATLIERIDHHEDLTTFRIRFNDHDVPEFQPGQYATLGLPGPDPGDGHPPKLIRRMYSIASPATDREALSFYIVKVDEGSLTPSLFHMNVGDKLFMAPRLGGHFTLEPVPADHHVVTIGTGTGLAPFRSMYLTYRDAGRWNKFVLIEGCRFARDLAYVDELKKLADNDDDFIYLPSTTREPDGSDWPGYRGRIHGLLEPDLFKQHTGFALDPANASVFLCGNPAMIDQCEDELGQRGFIVHNRKHPQGTLHFERYW